MFINCDYIKWNCSDVSCLRGQPEHTTWDLDECKKYIGNYCYLRWQIFFGWIWMLKGHVRFLKICSCLTRAISNEADSDRFGIHLSLASWYGFVSDATPCAAIQWIAGYRASIIQVIQLKYRPRRHFPVYLMASRWSMNSRRPSWQ